MKKIWIAIGVIVIVVLSIVLIVTQTKKEPKEIKIGAILPLTGPAATLGEWVKSGHELAIEEINTKSKILKIKYIPEDGMGDPKTSVSAFKKLVEVNKVSIIFTTLSNVTLALIPLLDKYKVILYTNAAHPQIIGKSKFVLRHGQVAEEEANTISNFLLSNNIPTVSIISLNDDYGVIFANTLKNIATNKNIVVKNIVFYEQGETDFKTEVQKLISSSPKAVVIGGYGKAIGFILKRLKEVGFNGTIIATSLFNSPETFQIAGDAAIGVYHTDFLIDYSDERVKELKARYEAKFSKEIHPLTIFSYNDMLLIIEAIIKRGSDSPTKIIEYILNLKEFKGAGETISIQPNGNLLIPLIIKKYSGQL